LKVANYFTNMPKKKKPIQKDNKPENEIDPFDGLQRPALKNMIDMMTWHYRMKPNQLPTFLHEYRVIHFIGAEKQLDADFSVYELYHCILQSHSDRNSLSACISKGETIAIWEKEKPTAISAITFLQRENSVLVLFLATLVEYQNAGMCTFLLSIMHQVVNCRVRCNGVNVFLKANPKGNEGAWRYYKARNFSDLKEDRKAFPKVLTDCFADEVDDSPLKDYLVFSKDLKWLTICLTREYFALPLDVDQKRVKERLFYNPTDETIHCPCLYAAFPGNLTYDDVAHCTLNYNEYSEKFWDGKAFHPSNSSDTQNQELYQGPTARFTWIERCLRRKGDSLSPDLLGIALAWLQRYSKAEIWSKMTIIPTAVMTEVFVMETVFTFFIEGRNYLSQLPPEMKKRSKAEKRDLAKHIFHFDIDSKRFMEASIPVVEYILQNKALFAKPFIAMAAQNYKDYSWTAFMAVNCAGIENNEKDRMCGYFLFDPTGTRNPRHPPMRCKFFLKLAHLILNDETVPLSKQKGEKSPWKDSVVAPWFTTLHEFYKRFTRQTLNFGCVMTDKDNEKCDIEDGRFRLLKLPPGYMFCSTKGGDVQENEGHEDRPGDVNPNVKERKEKLERTQSGIKSLIFIHDFCTMVHNVTLENIGNVKGDMTFDDNGVVSGMGRQIPHSKRMFNQYIQDVQMSLYQLTDRIASTQMGLVREESDEYEEYLRPGKTVERRMLLGAAIQMPKPEEPFPDLAKYKKWKPPSTERPQTLITAGSQECQRNEVESPNNRMRKPRMKDKEKKARAEQEAKSPRRSTLGEDHDEVHGTSTLKQTPHKKKNTIAEMQPAQDKHPATEMPRKIPQRETRQTIAGASHSIEFLPCTDNIDECTSTFRNDFQKATSEQMKRNLCWKAFALLHNKTPMPAFVDNTLNSIRASLEKEERNDSMVEVIGEKDVLCGRGARLCMAYLNRPHNGVEGNLLVGKKYNGKKGSDELHLYGPKGGGVSIP
jgi:hypothetical protein